MTDWVKGGGDARTTTVKGICRVCPTPIVNVNEQKTKHTQRATDRKLDDHRTTPSSSIVSDANGHVVVQLSVLCVVLIFLFLCVI